MAIPPTPRSSPHHFATGGAVAPMSAVDTWGTSTSSDGVTSMPSFAADWRITECHLGGMLPTLDQYWIVLWFFLMILANADWPPNFSITSCTDMGKLHILVC